MFQRRSDQRENGFACCEFLIVCPLSSARIDSVFQTHNIPLVAPLADFVVSVKDGKIASQGTLDAALNSVEALAEEVQEQAEELKDEGQAETDGADNKPSDTPVEGQLIIAEEVQVGRVGASAGVSLPFSVRSAI